MKKIFCCTFAESFWTLLYFFRIALEEENKFLYFFRIIWKNICLLFIIILEKYLFTFLNNSWFFLLLFWIITLCRERICVDTKPFQLIISKFDSTTIFKQVWLLKTENLNWIGFVSKYRVLCHLVSEMALGIQTFCWIHPSLPALVGTGIHIRY